MTMLPTIGAHVQCAPQGAMKHAWFDPANGLPDGIAIRWIGDNLGLGDNPITVTVACELGKGYLTLEEALRRINQFEEYGRARILSALPFQFNMPEASMYGSTTGGVQ